MPPKRRVRCNGCERAVAAEDIHVEHKGAHANERLCTKCYLVTKGPAAAAAVAVQAQAHADPAAGAEAKRAADWGDKKECTTCGVAKGSSDFSAAQWKKANTKATPRVCRECREENDGILIHTAAFFEATMPCSWCHGVGAGPGSDGADGDWIVCRNCGGCGRSEPCEACGGTGVNKDPKAPRGHGPALCVGCGGHGDTSIDSPPDDVARWTPGHALPTLGALREAMAARKKEEAPAKKNKEILGGYSSSDDEDAGEQKRKWKKPDDGGYYIHPYGAGW